MNYRIKKRHILVAMIVTAQLVCLVIGTFSFNGWLRDSMRRTIHDQVLADNIQFAQQMTTLIRRMDVGNLREDQAAWGLLQNVIHEIELPNDGFVCVVDADDGQLLCHPALGNGNVTTKDGGPSSKAKMQKPGMVKRKMVKPGMVKPGMVKPGMVKPSMVKPTLSKSRMRKSALGSSGDVPEGVSASVREHAGELQIIAAAYVPELNANVNVHQKASGIEKNINRLLKPVLPIGLSVSAILFLFTTAIILAIMDAYDNRLARVNENLEGLVDQRTQSLRRVRDAVIFGLAKLAESRDTDTGDHLERIGFYVSVLACELAKTNRVIDSRYVDNLVLASSLHDIGKVAIPDVVLLKTGQFNPDERRIMETHAERGGLCLDAISDQLGEDDFLELSREIAYCHHEKWDGTGYPLGIEGEAIPFSARIVALADVYDALRSRRPYKEPMPHAKAKEIIVDGLGAHFDPEVVNAFLRTENKFIQISEKCDTPTSDQSEQRQPALATT